MNLICTLTGWNTYFLLFLLAMLGLYLVGGRRYPVSATPTAFASQIGQFPTGEGGSRRPANEAFINNLYQNKITFCCHHAVKAETAEKFQPLVYSSAEIDGRMRIGADSDE